MISVCDHANTVSPLMAAVVSMPAAGGTSTTISFLISGLGADPKNAS
eukprot:CAMPEP_0196210388 /NCGR_PEP_ID=MMETSP0912-20130531/12910_1 /TAXON_ID=49265 /ORGANISM="Thalassiosira rotula, Strain GSO102" /LENGTH=46 /DNA_ID= /DNA_START= /DNA_END= /DNA_ORIENTATION=